MKGIFSTPLGEMRIIEYYLYYDRPFIFQCEDTTARKYIVHLIDDNEFGETYFFIPTSDSRIEAVRTGRISLRDSIVNSETLLIWEVIIPFDGSKGSVNLRECKDLKDNELPAPDGYLDLPDNILPPKTSDPEIDAKQLYRDILYLYLNDGHHSQMIYAEHLGAILLRSQNLVYSLVADYEGASKGRIPKSIKERGALYFTGDFAASVGIKLEAKFNELIDSTFHNALESILNLLSASTDKEKLSEVLAKINRRSIVRYRYFLQGLQQANVSFKAEWGSPKKGKRTVSLSHEEINFAMSLLDLEGEDMTQVVYVSGELVGLLTDKKYTFEFVSNDGERYRGTLSDDLRREIKNGLSINVPAKNVMVELEETIEINQTTNEESINYVLLKIQ